MEKLLSPVSIGNLTLKNRVVMAPMTRNFSKGGVPTEDVARYYAARSSVGLIITEGTVVNHPGANGYNDVPFFYGDEALGGWQKVVDQVHSQGGKIFPQLWHVGTVRRLGMEPDPTVPAFGPMGLEKGGKLLIKGMTKSDVDDVISAYVEGAVAAQKLGFDGVEIHGAHGYLIDQFLFAGSNRRSDEYGGSIEKRCRLAQEIIKGVRGAVGPDFPISFRYSQWKMTDYQAKLAQSPQELETILDLLVDAGVDIFHCSTRRFWEPEFEGESLNLAGWTKRITGKPCITVGSVGLDQDFLTTFDPKFEGASQATSLERLTESLDRDEFDLVAVGRGLIANPDWVDRVKNQQELVPYRKECLAELA